MTDEERNKLCCDVAAERMERFVQDPVDRILSENNRWHRESQAAIRSIADIMRYKGLEIGGSGI